MAFDNDIWSGDPNAYKRAADPSNLALYIAATNPGNGDFIYPGLGADGPESTIGAAPPGVAGYKKAYAALNTGTSAGSMPSDVRATADDYINRIYAARNKAAIDALTNAYNQNVLGYQAAKDAIPGTYNTARNSAAAQNAIQKSNFNQYAAGSGLNSGAGGQAQLALGNQLQANLSGLDSQQSKDTSAVDLQMAQLKAKFNGDIATAISNGEIDKAQAMFDQYVRDQSAAREDKWFQTQMDYNQSSSDYTKQANKAQTLAQSGDFSGYKALGYKDEEIASMQAAYQKTLFAKTTPSYGGSGSSGVFENTSQSGQRAQRLKSAAAFVQSAIAIDRSREDIAEGLSGYGLSSDDIVSILRDAGLYSGR